MQRNSLKNIGGGFFYGGVKDFIYSLGLMLSNTGCMSQYSGVAVCSSQPMSGTDQNIASIEKWEQTLGIDPNDPLYRAGNLLGLLVPSGAGASKWLGATAKVGREARMMGNIAKIERQLGRLDHSPANDAMISRESDRSRSAEDPLRKQIRTS